MGLISSIKNKILAEPDRWGDGRENKDRSEEKLSPSGRYRLVIRYYDQGRPYWNFSRGTVYRVEDGVEVADIKRNYSTFHHSFVTKDGQEWLISGHSYMGQTIVNLDTGIELNDKQWKSEKYQGTEFCWAVHMLSPDGNTLLIDGCHWACPYEYKFYDFTNPTEEGWAELPIINLEGEQTYIYSNSEGKEPEFVEDTVVCYETTRMFKPTGQREDDITEEEMEEIGDEVYDDDSNWEELDEVRIVLKRVGDEMHVVEWWKSDYKQERERRAAEFQKKFDAKVAAFRESERCQRVHALGKKHKIPMDYAAGWRAWKNWEVNFHLRRKKPKGSADLTWETEGDADILVRLYDSTGNNPEEFFFSNDDEGFEAALQRVEEAFR